MGLPVLLSFVRWCPRTREMREVVRGFYSLVNIITSENHSKNGSNIYGILADDKNNNFVAEGILCYKAISKSWLSMERRKHMQ